VIGYSLLDAQVKFGILGSISPRAFSRSTLEHGRQSHFAFDQVEPRKSSPSSWMSHTRRSSAERSGCRIARHLGYN
jgi:hypothetical protein